MLLSCLTALLVLVALPSNAVQLRVIDGDGLVINGSTVRLWGIDAPELHQQCWKNGNRYPCGQQSKQALQRLIEGGTPHCKAVTVDRYGRTIARCYASGNDLASMIVRQGWALDYPRYSGSSYANDQKAASDARRGIWVGRFVAPWKWRKGQR